ncbi:MAG: type I 3-dehydroquinate dehydratase [Turicibacter sp.]|nr:type I 3-dehydroquinate dehydratase [Turicibacter sp.]
MVTVKNLTIGSGMPKICVPIMGTTKESLLQELSMLEDYDLVEWRADFFEGNRVEMSKILTDFLGDVPLLLTFRTVAEGGNGWISSDAFLELAAHASYDILDVEMCFGEVKAAISLAHERQKTVLLSNHDFEKTPSSYLMKGRIQRMAALGADICKLAVMPKTPEDVLALLQATAEAKKLLDKPLVTIAMGELGFLTRVAGGTFGSAMTFASGTGPSAPGQASVSEMRMLMKYFAGKG